MAAILGPKPTPATYVEGFYATAIFIVIAIALSLMIKPPRPPEALAKDK
jgi:hypothetical protein